MVCTAADLGFLGQEPGRETKGMMKFNPLMGLPYKGLRLFPGEKNAFYLAGRNPKTGNYEVYLFQAGKEETAIKKLFVTRKNISAVAGDGKTTYVAAGNSVQRVLSGETKPKNVFIHPRESITGLEFSSGSGLFFTTGSSVGFAGKKKNFEFMRSPNCRIRLRNERLYILLGNSYGMLQIEGIGKFRDL